jgi:ribonucleoside-diphosphate reductase alpha chain
MLHEAFVLPLNGRSSSDLMKPPSQSEPPAGSSMHVRKRDGRLEPVDVNKIVRAVQRSAGGLPNVDIMRIAVKTIGGLFDGATTRELDRLSIQTAASLIAEEPEYSQLAARLLECYIDKEVMNQDIHSFSQAIAVGRRLGIVSEETATFVASDARKLNSAVDRPCDVFEYFGLRTVYDRYLLHHPITRDVIETPAYFFLRVACGLSSSVSDALSLFNLMVSHRYMPSSPTLFNSGTPRSQMSSCYLLDSPGDDLEGIYARYADVARLSKYAGGIGLAYHRIRSRGSHIQGTNGHSNGVVPWLKTLDSSVAAVNQGGRRKGACAVYLETWHADIEEFLELKDNAGDEARRTYNLNLANWVPDLFMRRVEKGEQWSLFDPKIVPHLADLHGDLFEAAYSRAEEEGLAVKQVGARELYARMMKSLAETGNGWMNFKDACNRKSNQTLRPENVVHSSNLCTEIVEVTSAGETAVCNLGSINLARHVKDGEFDFIALGETAQTAVRFLDAVIDINFYPTSESDVSNRKWRPVGLGLMGLQDVFFQLRLPFDSPEARDLSVRI